MATREVINPIDGHIDIEEHRLDADGKAVWCIIKCNARKESWKVFQQTYGGREIPRSRYKEPLSSVDLFNKQYLKMKRGQNA